MAALEAVRFERSWPDAKGLERTETDPLSSDAAMAEP